MNKDNNDIMSKLMMRARRDNPSRIDLALYTLWEESFGHEQMAIDAAVELFILRDRLEKIEDVCSRLAPFIHDVLAKELAATFAAKDEAK